VRPENHVDILLIINRSFADARAVRPYNFGINSLFDTPLFYFSQSGGFFALQSASRLVFLPTGFKIICEICEICAIRG